MLWKTYNITPYLLKKHPDISGPEQFKPTLFTVYIHTYIYTPPPLPQWFRFSGESWRVRHSSSHSNLWEEASLWLSWQQLGSPPLGICVLPIHALQGWLISLRSSHLSPPHIQWPHGRIRPTACLISSGQDGGVTWHKTQEAGQHEPLKPSPLFFETGKTTALRDSIKHSSDHFCEAFCRCD